MMRLSENLRTVTDADGGVVLDLHKGKIFRLNPVGAAIFELLARGSEEEQIAADISRRCDIDLIVATRDVREFLDLLAHDGLLQRPNASDCRRRS